MKFGKFTGIPERNEEAGFEWGTLKLDNMGFINSAGEEVLISGKKLSWWKEHFGLPIHIVYAPIMKKNIENFKTVFEKHYPNGEIRFAGKVNAHPSVFKMMSDLKVGADVASINEMQAALQGGIPPENLDLNGNAKSDKLIIEGIKHNMFFIADSYEEMKNIHKHAKKLEKKPRVALRVAGFRMKNATDANIFTAGVWSKFGENMKNIPGIIKNLDKFPYLDIQGFHAHVGSQITSPDSYFTVLSKLVEFSQLLENSGGNCRLINIGGGFPAEYIHRKEWEYIVNRVRSGYLAGLKNDHSKAFVWNNEHGGLAVKPNGKIDAEVWSGEKMHSEFPREKMLEQILTGEITYNGKKLAVKKAFSDLGNPRIVIEPGRSIAEDSGITLSQVSHVRKVAGEHFLTTVEANVTNFATAMLLPPVNQWTVMNEPFKTDDKPFETFVGGNLCYSGDIISKYKVFLQRKPKRGDVLCCYHTGAYDPSFFAANTNSFPRPPRIFTDDNGVIDIIKRRDTYNEIYSLDNDN